MSKNHASQAVGRLGEDLAARYLKGLEHTIVNQNYHKPWGELDLVTRETGGVIHFVEVKTVSYETRSALNWAVSHETWRPEEMVHSYKLHQIHKVAETWLSEHDYGENWQIDVVALRIVPQETLATVNYLENIT